MTHNSVSKIKRRKDKVKKRKKKRREDDDAFAYNVLYLKAGAWNKQKKRVELQKRQNHVTTNQHRAGHNSGGDVDTKSASLERS